MNLLAAVLVLCCVQMRRSLLTADSWA